MNEILRPVTSKMIAGLEQQPPLPPPKRLPETPVPARECGEGLVAVEPIALIDAYAQLGILGTRPMLVRSTVQQRLREADSALPAGFRLVVLDAWRSAADQRALVDHYSAVGDTSGWVADPDSATMRAPHMTGGAVDLTLMFGGVPLALGSAFDEFLDIAHLDSLEGSDSPERELRRLLSRHLSAVGFVSYPLEWWHWSFGEDVWAVNNGCEAQYDICDK